MEPKRAFDVQPAPRHPSPHPAHHAPVQPAPQYPGKHTQIHPVQQPVQQGQQPLQHTQHQAQQRQQDTPHHPGALNMDAPYRSPLQVAQVNPQQVQPPQDQPTEVKKPKNPARKWLMVSAAGVAICLFALGIGALRGGDSNLNPLPKKVLAQVFGFTPYYFNKDTPPAHLKLDATTPKFFGNALTFTLTDPKQEKITITQQTLPTGNFKRLTGDTTPTPLGEATIKMGGGKIEAELITKDNTYINIKASDFVSSGTLIDIFGNMSAAPKGAEALKQQ